MTIVFVHGVPDTPAIWGPLIDELGQAGAGALTLQLPGFGVMAPDRFPATADAYLAWLENELEKLFTKYGPVDVVGHDWGGILAWGFVNRRPDLIRTWTIIAAPVWPYYKWHFFARVWQTPSLGEFSTHVTPRWMTEKLLAHWNMPEGLAAHEAGCVDAEMRSSILRLYRSGKSIGADWPASDKLDKQKGLFIFGERDPFMKAHEAAAFADALGVENYVEPDAGHWLIAECPENIAPLMKRRLTSTP